MQREGLLYTGQRRSGFTLTDIAEEPMRITWSLPIGLVYV